MENILNEIDLKASPTMYLAPVKGRCKLFVWRFLFIVRYLYCTVIDFEVESVQHF